MTSTAGYEAMRAKKLNRALLSKFRTEVVGREETQSYTPQTQTTMVRSSEVDRDDVVVC